MDATGEVRQDGLGGLAVALLELPEGFLLGPGSLLFVAALLVPLGGSSGEVQVGEDQCDGESARNVGGVDEFPGCMAEFGGRLVIGADR